MAITKRKSLGKSVRFRIFARDQFICRYCGAMPPNVKLVIDHVIPVSAGGTNDEGNLITSCEGCNSGKSDTPLGMAAPTPEDQAKLGQEYLEQIDIAKLAKEAATADADLREVLCGCWETYFSIRPLKVVASNLTNLAYEFGPQEVIRWINFAASREVRERNAMQYINGIARNVRAEGEQ